MSAASSADRSVVRELTLRGVVIGGLITLVFTAANVYLGLKVGLTFATSIPAAVISMTVLRYFADHSVVENNIVQTIASAAGTLSAIIFVLPGLVIVGWWKGFPYWTTMLVCLVGGVLGVAYSIPLRRALVTGSDLPYPEGVAGAEVLRVGDTTEGAEENRRGMRVIVVGSLAAAGFSLLAALKVVSGSLQKVFHLGGGGTMVGSSLSLALIGVGHLVGLSVGVAMVVGLLISFGVLLPIKTSGHLPSHGDITDAVTGVFATDVRFIGAGAIAVAAIWTLAKIIGPIIRGIKDAMVSNRTRQGGGELDVTERDMPITLVAGIVLLSLIPIAALLWGFAHDTALHGSMVAIIVLSLIFVLVIGLLVAAVCGYMAGLIGSSNSPISGVGILVVLAAALLIKAVHGGGSGAQTEALVAFTLFTASIVFGVATISNDNLQDLKTGQLVGSTPWKQQVALVIGVVFGSLVIPPILDLMNNSFGFLGAPGAGKNALAAPQASLISSLAKGVFGGSLDWGLIGLGAAIGVVVIIVDEILGKTTGRLRLPPLAVGMGMYLPVSLTLMIPIGAVIGTLYDRWADRSTTNPQRVKRLGVLVATGFIVGESLFGVLLAAIVAATGNDSPLAVVGDGFLHASEWLGALIFVLLIGGVYQWTRKISTAGDSSEDSVAGLGG